MNTIARLKDCITKLKNTEIEINIVLARNLENLLITYISSKSKPLLGNDENTSKVDPAYEVIPLESSPVNLDAFINREEGFNGWEDFEDIGENSSSGNIDKIVTKMKTNEEVHVSKTKDFELLRSTDNNKSSMSSTVSDAMNKINVNFVKHDNSDSLTAPTKQYSKQNNECWNGKDEFKAKFEGSEFCNSDAYNSREEGFGQWEDYKDETNQTSSNGEKKTGISKIKTPDVKLKKYTNSLDHKEPDKSFKIKRYLTQPAKKEQYFEFDKSDAANKEAFLNRDDGFGGWEEFEDEEVKNSIEVPIPKTVETISSDSLAEVQESCISKIEKENSVKFTNHTVKYETKDIKKGVASLFNQNVPCLNKKKKKKKEIGTKIFIPHILLQFQIIFK